MDQHSYSKLVIRRDLASGPSCSPDRVLALDARYLFYYIASMARWSIPKGTTVYAVPRVLYGLTATTDWHAPIFGQAHCKDLWIPFVEYMDAPVHENGETNIRWDKLAKRTNMGYEFLSGDGHFGNAIEWSYNKYWFFVALVNHDPEFIGFLVSKENCQELPF